jgi:hypothetical protein
MGNQGWIVAGLSTGLVACAGYGGGGGPPSEDVVVQAAAVRWLVENNDSALRSSANAYCLGLGTGPAVIDPSVSLLRELRGTLPPVQPISRCAWARDVAVGARVVDELSEAPALALFVDSPVIEGQDEAQVWMEYLERPGLRGGYDCRLTRTAMGWQVARCDRRLPR